MAFMSYSSRRTFLQAVGTGVPALKLMLARTTPAAAGTGGLSPETSGAKFTPVDLGRYFTASPQDFGPREQVKKSSPEAARDGLLRLPCGKQVLRECRFGSARRELSKSHG